MYICYEGHDEIVHEGRDCPACELKSEKEELERENEELKEKISDLE